MLLRGLQGAALVATLACRADMLSSCSAERLELLCQAGRLLLLWW